VNWISTNLFLVKRKAWKQGTRIELEYFSDVFSTRGDFRSHWYRSCSRQLCLAVYRQNVEHLLFNVYHIGFVKSVSNILFATEWCGFLRLQMMRQWLRGCFIPLPQQELGQRHVMGAVASFVCLSAHAGSKSWAAFCETWSRYGAWANEEPLKCYCRSGY